MCVQVLMPYYHRLSSQLRAGAPEVNQAAERVVYTALHGVGTQALTTAFQVRGTTPLTAPKLCATALCAGGV